MFYIVGKKRNIYFLTEENLTYMLCAHIGTGKQYASKSCNFVAWQ